MVQQKPLILPPDLRAEALQLMGQHPEAVLEAFDAFGIKEEATPETLLLGFVAHKDEFTEALDGVASADGKSEGKFAKLLAKTLGIITTVGSLAQGLKTATDPNAAPSDNAVDPPRKPKLPPVLLWGGISVLVLVLIAVFMPKKK